MLAAAGVAALLLVLVVSVSLISGAAAGDAEQQDTAATAPTPTPTPEPTPTPKPRPTPVPLTAEERAERQAAADIVASRGFEVTRLRDWDPRDTLRVLIGRTTSGAELAFFFVNGDYIGNDSDGPEREAEGACGPTDLTTTLRYGVYAARRRPDEADGRADRRAFTWDGARLAPQTAVPAPEQRTPGRQPG